jgi:hypothetical protein
MFGVTAILGVATMLLDRPHQSLMSPVLEKMRPCCATRRDRSMEADGLIVVLDDGWLRNMVLVV